MWTPFDSDSSGAVSLGEFLRAIPLDPSVAVTLGLDASSPTIAALEAVFPPPDSDGSRALAPHEFAPPVRSAAAAAATRPARDAHPPPTKTAP